MTPDSTILLCVELKVNYIEPSFYNRCLVNDVIPFVNMLLKS